MSDTLSTLVQRCRHQQEIRKSRFLAIAAPVSSAEQALAFLREVADPAATHNCWAWRIGASTTTANRAAPPAGRSCRRSKASRWMASQWW